MDLIDRGAAIDAVNEIIRMEHSLRPKVYVAKDAIKKLPPVQPTFDARDTQYNLPIGTDLIGRQAAIDAINEIIRMEHSLRPKVYVAKDAIKKLPSAVNVPETNVGKILDTISRQPVELLPLPSVQPEIIRCKDCKYKDDGIDEDGIPFLKCLHGRSYGGTRINDFCSWAERREE
jgi:hypothetical protein